MHIVSLLAVAVFGNSLIGIETGFQFVWLRDTTEFIASIDALHFSNVVYLDVLHNLRYYGFINFAIVIAFDSGYNSFIALIIAHRLAQAY